MTVRMLAMPTWGLLRGSGRLPVAQPSTAGGPAHTDTWCLPPSMRSRISRPPSSPTVRRSTPRNCSAIPSRSPTICSVAPAPREADSQPPKSSSLVLSRPAMAPMAPASAAAVSNESAKPEDGPSSATSSKGTFCATVIITCCSLALGPKLTSQTLLPGVVHRSGASRRPAPVRPRGPEHANRPAAGVTWGIWGRGSLQGEYPQRRRSTGNRFPPSRAVFALLPRRGVEQACCGKLEFLYVYPRTDGPQLHDPPLHAHPAFADHGLDRTERG